jgi:hypothetical protein
LTQQINLFNPAFRRQRVRPSMSHVIAGVVIAVAALAALQFHFERQVKGLNEELLSAQALLKTRQTYVAQLQAAGEAAKGKSVVDAEISKLETELKAARETMEALKGGALGSQQGFSEYMRAFSRQSLNGLWLTGFAIAGAGDISIQGRVTNADLIPSYIERLRREKVLQGRSFATFDVHQVKAEPVETAKGKDERKIARYLEFTLTTMEPGADAVAAIPKAGSTQ